MSATEVDDVDRRWLRRCVELAEEALADGDSPFGSVLVDGSGAVRAEDRNREVSTADPTAHPEIALARWAAAHLDPEERAAATVYTSGEHCAMCAAARSEERRVGKECRSPWSRRRTEQATVTR